MEPETRLVAGGTAPLARTTIEPFVDGVPGPLFYQRYAHSVGVRAEELLGDLDGGHALLFASGMGAVTTVVLGLLEPGATVAVAAGGYYGTEALIRTHLSRWGVTLELFDQTGPPPPAELVWLEPCANPMLSFPDLDASIAAAHAAGSKVLVDNTVLSPLLLTPLAHGADFVLHSATKILAGHHDALLGVVICADAAAADRLRTFRGASGIVAAPDPAVQRIRYPGLDDPVAARYVRAFGPLLSFDVADGDRAARVERALQLIENATSLGGTASTLEARHRYEGDRCPPGLLRLSVGLEDADDLWADLAQALGAATQPS